ncbi:hypothetical protein [Mycobacterium kubicae]|uniref:hypothetical protein n=1 Tax=Mycobacterium kubicae TaxID=120959 RepID=UPI000A152A7A|nr:hypothetical protein [Mycobacterium kubicae]MCV7098004.1 hypothetical protein [Mycobacterium kubicae]ORW05518.1 hypothetical protein AWC13_25470 [Mycobacterium kubicae]
MAKLVSAGASGSVVRRALVAASAPVLVWAVRPVSAARSVARPVSVAPLVARRALVVPWVPVRAWVVRPGSAVPLVARPVSAVA